MLGLLIQYVGKERTLHIKGEYEKQILFPFLVCEHKYLKPSYASEKVLSSTSQNIQPTSSSMISWKLMRMYIIINDQRTINCPMSKLGKPLMENAKIFWHGGKFIKYNFFYELGL